MSDDFKITKVKRSPYFDMKVPHFHPKYEIYYLLDGTSKMFLEDSIYILNKGDMVFIPINAIHKTSYVNDKTHERIAITFGDKAVPDFNGKGFEKSFKEIFTYPSVIKITRSSREYINALLERMLSEYNSPDKFSELNLKNIFQELVIFLIRYKNYKTDEYDQNINSSDTLMQKAARFIRANYMNDLTLEDVAGYVNVSPTYFSKKFKLSTGFGYKEYLVSIRIQAASHMLLDTDKSITRIAMDCGWNDSNYFGDVFKKAKGISPLKYRKNSFKP